MLRSSIFHFENFWSKGSDKTSILSRCYAPIFIIVQISHSAKHLLALILTVNSDSLLHIRNIELSLWECSIHINIINAFIWKSNLFTSSNFEMLNSRTNAIYTYWFPSCCSEQTFFQHLLCATFAELEIWIFANYRNPNFQIYRFSANIRLISSSATSIILLYEAGM